ncbi:MAG: N-acetylmuramoyl-L-alanine amidase [Eubacterium sp.]|nr:N-acetylmuramoyl-L-alanine amidase [Eubacterium sp.]
MNRKRCLAMLLELALAFSIGPVIPARADEEEQNQKIVCIDAGHQTRANTAQEPIGPGSSQTKYKVTGGTSGCVTHVPEYKLNLRMAKKLRKELKVRGYKVVMVRTTNDVNISNIERAEIANDCNADAFIRIHANSVGSSSTKGALTCAPTSHTPFLSAKVRKKSQKFSKLMIDSFCKATGAANRGIMWTDSMTGINWCKVPVTIIEMGFMSNPEEDRLMQTEDYQAKMVQGMADGIDEFLK